MSLLDLKIYGELNRGNVAKRLSLSNFPPVIFFYVGSYLPLPCSSQEDKVGVGNVL